VTKYSKQPCLLHDYGDFRVIENPPQVAISTQISTTCGKGA